MNRVEALEWAADYAERNKIFEPVRNERGYADGWKIPTPAERSKIISDLAEQVAEGPATEGNILAPLYILLEQTISQLRILRAKNGMCGNGTEIGGEVQDISNRLDHLLKEMRKG